MSRLQILEYVESRITLLAPNISAIVGTQTATKILGIAGGLQGLVRIPHSNIYVRPRVAFPRALELVLTLSRPRQQLLGAVKRANTGFSTAAHSVDRLHTGFIYQCPLVQQTRNEDRMKAQRKVGAKVALAARVDMAKSAPTGSFGEEMKGKLEGEMERLARPAPSKVTKALPRPDAQKKNRRGGKRCVHALAFLSFLARLDELTLLDIAHSARKAKEAYAQTELRKLQNRLKFGEAEEEVGAYDDVQGMGMIGSSSGRVRANVAEARSKGASTALPRSIPSSTRAGLTRTASTQQNCPSRPRVASRRSSPCRVPQHPASRRRSRSRPCRVRPSLPPPLHLPLALLTLSLALVSAGLELVDPSKMRSKVDEANAKWFAEGAFSHVPKGGGIGKPGSSTSK